MSIVFRTLLLNSLFKSLKLYFNQGLVNNWNLATQIIKLLKEKKKMFLTDFNIKFK